MVRMVIMVMVVAISMCMRISIMRMGTAVLMAVAAFTFVAVAVIRGGTTCEIDACKEKKWNEFFHGFSIFELQLILEEVRNDMMVVVFDLQELVECLVVIVKLCGIPDEIYFTQFQ